MFTTLSHQNPFKFNITAIFMDTEKITLATRLKSFVGQCIRVWHLLKKPDKQEFTTIAKVSAIGLGIVGAMGFFIGLLMAFLKL